MAFAVHSSGASPSRRASKAVTGLFLLMVAAALGGGAVFWFDRPKLVQHVRERDALAVAACFALRWQGAPEEARAPLLEAMEVGHPTLRAAAAKALASRKKHEDVPFIGQLATRDPEVKVRIAACEGLTITGEGYAREWLRFAIDDPSQDVQAAACEAVGACQVTELVPFLIEKVEVQHVRLRQNAIHALERFLGPGEDSCGAKREQWQEWWNRRNR